MDKDKDYDATDHLGGEYLRKQDLRDNGPRRWIIRDVEQSDRLKDKSGKPLLVLLLDDGVRYSLGTKINIKRLVEAYGKMCSGSIGRAVEFYYAEDVRGPNGEVGGIRLRIPPQSSQPAAPPVSPSVLVSELPSGGAQ